MARFLGRQETSSAISIDFSGEVTKRGGNGFGSLSCVGEVRDARSDRVVVPIFAQLLKKFFSRSCVPAVYESSHWFCDFERCAAEERATVKIHVDAAMIGITEKVEREIPTGFYAGHKLVADKTEINDGGSAGVACVVGTIMEMSNDVAQRAGGQEVSYRVVAMIGVGGVEVANEDDFVVG